jgi:hypothetical protein
MDLRAAAAYFREGIPEAKNELRVYYLVDVCEALLRGAPNPLSLDAIARAIDLPPSRRRSLSTTLCTLRRRGAARFDLGTLVIDGERAGWSVLESAADGATSCRGRLVWPSIAGSCRPRPSPWPRDRSIPRRA